MLWTLHLPAQTAFRSEPLQVEHTDGAAFVRADQLPEAAQIAIKELPGRSELVACHADRCALLEDSVRLQDRWLINVSELARALALRTDWNETRRQVTLRASGAVSNPEPGSRVYSVGSLAPDFRLPKLDGGWIRLSELRGRRVLINSWASW